MKILWIIIAVLGIQLSAFAGSEENLLSAWADRDTFSVNILKTVISLSDTTSEKGIFAVRKPDALYKTESEFLLYKNKTLFTFSKGSDVGMKTAMAEYEYADIAVLISKLRDNFELTYIPSEKGLVLVGKKGKGNIIEFRAEMDNRFLPSRISWMDALGYATILVFEKFNLEDPGNIFKPLKNVEFIEQ